MWDNKDAFHTDVSDTNWWWDKGRKAIIYDCIKRVALHNMKILEVGAGFGTMTTMLSKFGVVEVIEPYSDCVSYLQNVMKIKTYHGTFESFAGNEKYDMVTCFDVLEHIKDDRSALSKMESLLNDGGLLVVTVPSYEFLWSRHDEVNHHYRRYTKQELLTKIPQDLIIKKVSYFNTLLFPMAIFDKLVLSKNKKSYSFNPNRTINRILYEIFAFEKVLLRFDDLPFGVSILLIAEKHSAS